MSFTFSENAIRLRPARLIRRPAALVVTFLVMLSAWLLLTGPVLAQEQPPAEPAPVIEREVSGQSDAQIAERIGAIFAEIPSLAGVEVAVEAGVVSLSGMTATADAAARAEALASRVDGVVTVENSISRDVSVTTRVAPALDQATDYAGDIVRFLPLLALALLVFVSLIVLGWVIARFDGLWRRVTPNAFIAEIAKTTVRALFVVLAAIAALSLLDATALLGAFLGAAGVIGLAIGFAVRDTIENYVASIMLSLRQPFRPNDHVVIGDREGRVIRLTSRATILMTMQGNHLRIPNSTVFKAEILNYTTNTERRFEFELGVDADDDPLAAIETGLETLGGLDFVLAEPTPIGLIRHVGDSNIVLLFAGWIDQDEADFGKSRSVALAAVKTALEEEGFTLPEPIYRLRFDAGAPAALTDVEGARVREAPPDAVAEKRPQRPATTGAATRAADVSPDTDIARKVEEERREEAGADLLEEEAPTE